MAALREPAPERRRLAERLLSPKLTRLARNSDFRLLWIGAFLSFTGSWVQKIAEGYYVYQLTKDDGKLAIVNFAFSIPVFIFGFMAGSFADAYHKRNLLVLAQALFGLGALFLAAAVWFHFVAYWQLVAVAACVGLVSCVEMPTRQSIVSRVVPREDLHTAVPINAMTFNVARIIGPAIGGILLTTIGVAACYFVNGLSYLALIWAAYAIRSDLSAGKREAQPIRDLIFEGAIYTWREARLRTLLILETITAVFGIFYVALIPAYVEERLHIVNPNAAKAAIGAAYTSIGIGALFGLVVITHLSESERKGTILRVVMAIITVGLVALSLASSPWVAYVAMVFIGGSTMIQFNTTNSLFQILAPERLRGRVLSMHIWALNGLSPFGVLLFGVIAQATLRHPTALGGGIELVTRLGAIAMALGCVWAFVARRHLAHLR